MESKAYRAALIVIALISIAVTVAAVGPCCRPNGSFVGLGGCPDEYGNLKYCELTSPGLPEAYRYTGTTKKADCFQWSSGAGFMAIQAPCGSFVPGFYPVANPPVPVVPGGTLCCYVPDGFLPAVSPMTPPLTISPCKQPACP